MCLKNVVICLRVAVLGTFFIEYIRNLSAAKFLYCSTLTNKLNKPEITGNYRFYNTGMESGLLF